jgi:phage FluMu protein Com
LIDGNGNLRCANCGKILGRNLEGRIEIVCPRSSCHRYNVFQVSTLMVKATIIQLASTVSVDNKNSCVHNENIGYT